MRKISRRELFERFSGAGALLALGAGRGFADDSAKNLQVGLGTLGGSAARGAELGVEEARRTAELLRIPLRIGLLAESQTADVRIGEKGADPRGVLVGPARATGSAAHTKEPSGAAPGHPPSAGAPLHLALEPGPGGPRVFHLASSPAARARALDGRTDVRAVDWHPELERFGAEQLNQRYARRFGAPMDEAAWRGWMAVKVAAELALRGHLGPDVVDLLPGLSFDGHKGRPLRFDAADLHLVQPVYLIGPAGRLLQEVAP